ncbi:MAG: hypothetical protein NTX72_05770 [Candidatus Uhrbacteria bacterium]|nr:hypothetical protein [Candidatus Uhrbacteria bacterium]
MYRFVLLILCLASLISCERVTSSLPCVAGTQETVPGVCDDGHGIAYFLFQDTSRAVSDEENLPKLIAYRRAWQDKFPSKEIFSTNITSYDHHVDSCIIWYRERQH